MVGAAINHVPLSLLLDLGGFDTISLNKADSAKVGAQGKDQRRQASLFDGKLQEYQGLHFKAVTVGNAEFGEVEGSALSGEGNSYVGAGLLEKWLVVLDYPHSQVRLYKSGNSQALERECGTTTFPVDVRRGVFQTYMRTEGKLVTAAFDTGANFSVIRPSALNLRGAEHYPDSSPEIHKLREIRINRAKISELSAALIEFKAPPVDIVLGTNFFQGRRVCLDGPAHIGAMR